jgi:hypothetical protein
MVASTSISLIGWAVSNALIMGLLGAYIAFQSVDLKTIIWIGIAAGAVSAIFPNRTPDEEKSLQKLNDVLEGRFNHTLSYRGGLVVSFMVMLVFAVFELVLLLALLNPMGPLQLDAPFKSFFSFLLPYLMVGQVLMGVRRVMTG